MIIFVTSRSQQTNLKPLLADATAPSVATLFYDDALTKSHLPRGTYVFTAMGLLRPNDLTAAARLYRRLKENGCLVLNDPARVRTRFPLLRSLHRSGLNPFNVYSVEEEEKPRRFPVFVRVPHGSRPPLSELIWDQATLDRVLEAAIVDGIPRQSLMIVEYAAEPVRPGVFRKGSVYRIGDHFVPDVLWYGTTWVVKGDRDGLADEGLYNEELQMMRNNDYPKELELAFSIANIEYGRLDFGLVNGQPCIYEINTNPMLFGVRAHPIPARVETIKLKWYKLTTALRAIDTPGDAEELIEVAGTSIEALTKAATFFPALRFHHLRLSREHRRRGNISAALAAAEAEIAANPDSVRALSQLSRILVRQHRLDDAITALRKAVKLSPRRLDEQRRLATLLWETGRFEEMHDKLREALRYGLDKWQIQLLLSKVSRKLGDDRLALDAAAQAAELAPQDIYPGAARELSELSRILAGYGRLDLAIAISGLVIQLTPHRAGERRRLATLLLKYGSFEEARDHLLGTLASGKEHWNTHFLLSRIHEKLGNKKAALDAFKRAAQLAPNEPAVTKKLQRRRHAEANLRRSPLTSGSQPSHGS